MEKTRQRWVRTGWGAWVAEVHGLDPRPGDRVCRLEWDWTSGEAAEVARERGWLVRTSLSNRQLNNLGLVHSSPDWGE